MLVSFNAMHDVWPAVDAVGAATVQQPIDLPVFTTSRYNFIADLR